MASSQVRDIPLLGRNVALGQLYNGCTDNPLGTFLGNPDDLEKQTAVDRTPSTNMEAWVASSSEYTIQGFRINASADLSLSLHLGLTKIGAGVEVNADYVSSRRSSTDSVCVYVAYLG